MEKPRIEDLKEVAPCGMASLSEIQQGKDPANPHRLLLGGNVEERTTAASMEEIL